MARYTAKLLAAIKHAYEETDRPVDLIATDFDVSSRNIQRLVVTEQWKSRKARKHAPRDVPVALELLAQAQALVTLPPQSGGKGRRAEASRGGAPSDLDREAPPTPNPSPPLALLAEGGEPPELDAPPLSAADRLEALVLREIEAEEQGRNDGRDRRIGDGERRARALATLTQTLQTLQRMREGTAPAAEVHYDDDLPADPDAFRLDLARRIDAFMRSRPEDDDALEV